MIRRNNTAAAPAAQTTFGQRFGMQNVQPAQNDRVDAEVWLNIGYETGDENYPFVSLPYGIPLDTQNPLQVRGRDADFLAFTGARNGLLKQLKDLAETLAPGEDVIISVGEQSGLAIQIRRRDNKAQEPALESNAFAREFNFVDKVPAAA